MFRLKYSCPMQGHVLPVFAAIIAMPIGAGAMIRVQPNALWMLPAGALAAVFVLFCFFVYYQHLSPAEKDLCAMSGQPLWYPLPEDIIYILREEMQRSALGLLHAIGAAAAAFFVMVLCGISPTRRHPSSYRHTPSLETVVPIAACAAAAAFAAVLIAGARRRAWAQVDQTAVCTVIPVHHSYDVKRYGRRGRRWTENYIVCYLPDGRYVLHNKKQYTAMQYIIVIKFRGSIIWRPYRLEQRSYYG